MRYIFCFMAIKPNPTGEIKMKCLTNKIAMIVLTLTCTSTVFANTSQPSSQARAEVQVIKMAVGAYADAFGGILSQISDYQREYAAAGSVEEAFHPSTVSWSKFQLE